jgi:hypothetical protein
MSKIIQIYGASRRSQTLLNPDIAYSLRRVSDVYSGDYIRVRKVGGAGGEMSFGLVNGVVDVAAIEAFLNGNDGRVVRIFNVGSNLLDAFDLRQNAAGSQPFIARNGVVEVENGLPIIDFGGGNYFLDMAFNNAAIQDKDSLAAHVFKSQSGLEQSGVFEEVRDGSGTALLQRIVQYSDTRATILRHSNYRPAATQTFLDFPSQQPTNTLRQMSLERSGNMVNGYAENQLVDSVTNSQTFGILNTAFTLGRQSAGPIFFNGKWFETLIWASDNYDRNLIENNQMNYYGV